MTGNTGPVASAAWLAELGLSPPELRWYVEILITTDEHEPHDGAPTLLRVDLYSEEWGYLFRHGGRVSWIRITDVAFVHGHDDHALLAQTPALREIGVLARQLEDRLAIRLEVPSALIRTNLRDAEQAVRTWLALW